MKSKVFVHGKEIESLEDLPTGQIVIERRYVYEESDIEDYLIEGWQKSDVMNIVRNAMQLGKKIFAIKMVRKFTGWGLRESKEFVENIEY